MQTFVVYSRVWVCAARQCHWCVPTYTGLDHFASDSFIFFFRALSLFLSVSFISAHKCAFISHANKRQSHSTEQQTTTTTTTGEASKSSKRESNANAFFVFTIFSQLLDNNNNKTHSRTLKINTICQPVNVKNTTKRKKFEISARYLTTRKFIRNNRRRQRQRRSVTRTRGAQIFCWQNLRTHLVCAALHSAVLCCAVPCVSSVVIFSSSSSFFIYFLSFIACFLLASSIEMTMEDLRKNLSETILLVRQMNDEK